MMHVNDLLAECGGDKERAMRVVAQADYFNRIDQRTARRMKRKPIPEFNSRGVKIDQEATQKHWDKPSLVKNLIERLRADLIGLGVKSRVGSYAGRAADWPLSKLILEAEVEQA